MTLVKITHPEAGEALVPASAVPHWRTCGWSPVDETGEPDAPTPDRAATRRAPKGDK